MKKINILKKNNLVNTLFLPWLLPSIFYLLIVIFLVNNSSIFNMLEIIFFRGGFTVLVSFIFLNTIYNRSSKNKIIYILFGYLFVIFLNSFPFKSFAALELNLIEIDSSFLKMNLLFGILMSVYTISVHLFYLKEIKISTLTQQSLESQLNYQQLKNQISPHFLFNNINVLTSFIEENPKKAVLFSENLSNIYRYFLEQEKQDVVLVKEEINFAKSYLELLKDRFEVGLNFLITIDENAKDKYIVSTVLQQVLENVIKHNTINEDNIVSIKIASKENYLIVENNKIPKLVTEEISKKGIENIKKRIAFFTDEKVVIESTTEMYKIQLPILETI